MKKILIQISYIIFHISLVFAQEFDFTQEWDTIPVSFDSVECQVPWTTGYCYLHPTFVDIDGDIDQDLFFASTWLRLSYFQNNGDSFTPDFGFVTDHYVSLAYPDPEGQQELRPAFSDIDNDGDFDLLFGVFNRMFFYRNIGDSANPSFLLEDDFFQGINFATEHLPFFVDIDDDGDDDLFIGFGYVYTPINGRMAFYRNEGTPDSASMILESDFFMSIDLGDECVPSFCDLDDDGDFDMFLGDHSGNIHYYRNDGTAQVYDFTLVSDNYQNINVGLIASPSFTDIDGDGDFDLFVGERSWGEDNRHGEIDYYENTGTPDSAIFDLVTQNYLTIDIGTHANPALADIDDDGLLDMFSGDVDGNINYFSNTGDENYPSFTFIDQNFQSIQANYQSRPCFGDLDNDGDLEMLVGRTSWTSNGVKFFLNQGTPEEPDYIEVPANYIEINHDWASPELIDIDDDGDLDLFIGHLENQVIFYQNIGTPEICNFRLISDNYLNQTLQFGDFASICFGDIDNDGDYDIIRGHSHEWTTLVDAYLDFYRNVGTPENASFVLEEDHFLDIAVVKYAEPFLADIDTDGDLDLFVGDSNGGVSFLRNNEVNQVNGEQEKNPYTFMLTQNYPNPFNASTAISYQLLAVSHVNLTVYDVLGREVQSLVMGQQSAGFHEVVWDASGVSSGVYLVRLDSGDQTENIKTVLVK